MLFSILIANYNNSRFLETAIESVRRQSYIDWEIIIVDDGSTDGFENFIAPFKPDSRIKIFQNKKNFGCGYTKRKCAELASGSILAFLDPDDAITPDALQIMADAHHENPECSLIHSTHFICDASLTVKRIADYPKALPPNTPYLLLGDGSVHAFATFKKKNYDQTSGLSPLNKKAVDQDLYYLLEETGKILFINTPLYFYRIHDGSISNSGNEAQATIIHYAVIEEACLRRIAKLDGKTPASKNLIRLYKLRHRKIKIFHSFRKKQWLSFAYNLFLFPFAGGFSNTVSYFKKLPKEGMSLIRKSFVENFEIKA